MRLFWGIIGWIALILGAIGFVLPVFPTVPFVLVAAYAFARSSPKVYNWLMANKFTGPIIRDWQKNGSIARKTKIITTISLTAAIFFQLWLKIDPTAVLIEALVFVAVLVFVWTRPEPDASSSA